MENCLFKNGAKSIGYLYRKIIFSPFFILHIKIYLTMDWRPKYEKAKLLEETCESAHMILG